uniref:G_PROTEIN_RECEP_F1_2 domain-containing protein n=1 Tax=Angiostrongylus cantonensis TaxID=6313 RepID=A0A158P696_ANGCA
MGALSNLQLLCDVLHVFVPFAILLILNVSIVVLTKRKLHSIGWAIATFIDVPKVTELIRKESMMSSKKRRDEVRYATWTMVSITSTYLCCSSLSLFISVMENDFYRTLTTVDTFMIASLITALVSTLWPVMSSVFLWL